MYLPITERSTRAISPRKPALSGETFATFINLSGRRRFTSQRVVLYALLAAGKDVQALAVANEALDLFRNAHIALVKGAPDLPMFMSPALKEAYFGSPKGDEKILGFVALAERVLHAIASDWQRQIPVLMDELIQSTTPLLSVLNSITAVYETEAREHAKKVEGKLLAAMGEIKAISKHAQIVAMNARITAARAGAAGREFAVVATELISITSGIEAILQVVMEKKD